VSFQPDFKIKRSGNLIEINNGAAAVTFFPKDFSKTLETIINKIKQRQPDLFIKVEDFAYHREDIEAQLLQIYYEYEKETKRSTQKRATKIDAQNNTAQRKIEILTNIQTVEKALYMKP
jgi:hypothetical protein